MEISRLSVREAKKYRPLALKEIDLTGQPENVIENLKQQVVIIKSLFVKFNDRNEKFFNDFRMGVIAQELEDLLIMTNNLKNAFERGWNGGLIENSLLGWDSNNYSFIYIEGLIHKYTLPLIDLMKKLRLELINLEKKYVQSKDKKIFSDKDSFKRLSKDNERWFLGVLGVFNQAADVIRTYLE